MLRTSSCTNEIDYSKISGERLLPFRFVLDLDDSILKPEEGEYQTFCYHVTGVGRETPAFADLSYFLLGICDEIDKDDIVSISVTIDDKPQEIIWDKNVEIKTPEHPDQKTGCTGLKFTFPLDKADGEMDVCFSLATPHNIGPVDVCLFGGDVTATGLSICGPVCDEIHSCDSTFFQKETVCVPVTVTPFANAGKAKATCCGKPVVSNQGSCSGTRRSYTFTVTQTLCIEIPISFGAVVETGTATVQCGEVSEEGCDCD